jgi:hypothetical protein
MTTASKTTRGFNLTRSTIAVMILGLLVLLVATLFGPSYPGFRNELSETFGKTVYREVGMP